MEKLKKLFSPTRIMGSLLLLWSILYLSGIRGMEIGGLNNPGQGVFPLLLGSGLLILSLLVLIGSARQKESWSLECIKPVLLLGAGLIGAAWMMPWVGYPLTMIGLILFTLKTGGGERYPWPTSVALTLALVLVFYYLFAHWLLVPLPRGLFLDW